MRPSDISAGAGGLWVANLDDDSVTKIDPRTRIVCSGPMSTGTSVNGLTTTATRCGRWTRPTRPRYASIRPSARSSSAPGSASRPEALNGGPEPGRPRAPMRCGRSTVRRGRARCRRARATSRRTVDVGNEPAGIADGAGATWVADDLDDTVSQHRRAPGGATSTIPVGHGASAIAVGDGGVWVADTADATVTRLDPATGADHGHHPRRRRPDRHRGRTGAVWVAEQRRTGPCPGSTRDPTASSPRSRSATARPTSSSPPGRSGSRSRPARHPAPRRQPGPCASCSSATSTRPIRPSWAATGRRPTLELRDLRQSSSTTPTDRAPQGRGSCRRSRPPCRRSRRTGATYRSPCGPGFRFSPPSGRARHRARLRARDRALPEPQDARPGRRRLHLRRRRRVRGAYSGRARHLAGSAATDQTLDDPSPAAGPGPAGAHGDAVPLCRFRPTRRSAPRASTASRPPARTTSPSTRPTASSCC